MKEIIENLIKEIGINEAESILNELKSKANVKENIKKDFVELLEDCTISFNGNDIDYRKDGILLFYYRKNNNSFRLKYDIWSNFQSKYNLNYQELRDLLMGVVEEVLNYKGVIPQTSAITKPPPVEEVLNYKGVIPGFSFVNIIP